MLGEPKPIIHELKFLRAQKNHQMIDSMTMNPENATHDRDRSMSRALVDRAFALALVAVVCSRVGHVTFVRANEGASSKRASRERASAVWCDVSAARRNAIREGDEVIVHRIGASPRQRSAQEVVKVYEGENERGRCALARSRRWSATNDDGGDVGEIPIGAIYGKVAFVIWPLFGDDTEKERDLG